MAYNIKKKTEKVLTFKVNSEDRKLLEFLLENVKGKSRNNIKSMLSRGNVAVNGKLQKQFDLDLEVGDEISCQPRKIEDNGINPRLEILFENEDFIAINKPAGLLSISSDREKNNTAYNFVDTYLKKSDKEGKAFIVHRLDRDTSGIMIFAKNIQTKQAFQDNWNEIVSYRGYTCVVEGKPKKDSDVITSFLTETKTHFVFSTENESAGQKAVTEYNVLKTNGDFSIVDVKILTGRKNQIRVHFSEMGNPVCGDKKYGAKFSPIGRLCLHAGRLEFTHPETKEKFDFKVSAPKQFEKVLSIK